MSIGQPPPLSFTNGKPSNISKPQQTLLQDIVVRSIKMIDIGYITIIYFILAYVIAITIDTWLGPFNQTKNDKKSIFRIGCELIFQMWCFGMLTYVARNIVELIPFPLNGIYGFQHRRVKELGSAAVFSVILVWNSHNFVAKMGYLYTRVTKHSTLHMS